jgi:hypothetical protein
MKCFWIALWWLGSLRVSHQINATKENVTNANGNKTSKLGQIESTQSWHNFVQKHNRLNGTRKRCETPEYYAGNRTNFFKIGIIILFKSTNDRRWPSGWDYFVNLTFRNRIGYGALHSHDVLVASDCINPDRPIAWSKFDCSLKYLHLYDYIFIADMDALIMEPLFRLDTLVQSAGAHRDIIISTDWNGINSGVMLIKNTAWSHSFLKLCSKLEVLVQPKYPELPFNYEQRAFHYLLNTSYWRRKVKNPKYLNFNKTLQRSLVNHFGYLMYCAMNSHYAQHRSQYQVIFYILPFALLNSHDDFLSPMLVL